MYIFGGNDLRETFSDFWKIDLDPIIEYYFPPSLDSNDITSSSSSSSSNTNPIVNPLESIKWIRIENISADGDYPSPRIGHTMTAIGSNYFILYGGRNFLSHTMAFGNYNLLFLWLLNYFIIVSLFYYCLIISLLIIYLGIYLYDVNLNLWSNITPANYTPAENRTGHICIPTSHGLLYFGGLLTQSNQITSDVMFLDLFSTFYPDGEVNNSPSLLYGAEESGNTFFGLMTRFFTSGSTLSHENYTPPPFPMRLIE